MPSASNLGASATAIHEYVGLKNIGCLDKYEYRFDRKMQRGSAAIHSEGLVNQFLLASRGDSASCVDCKALSK